ncbi:MAG: AI-2E family transporter [Candidatus Nanopelagicales bacterium]
MTEVAPRPAGEASPAPDEPVAPPSHDVDPPVDVEPDHIAEVLHEDDVVERRTTTAGVAPDLAPLGVRGPRFARSPFTTGFFLAIGGLLAYTLFRSLATVSGALVLIVVALFLAVGLNPVVQFLEHRGMRRGFGVLVVFLGFALFMLLFGLTVLPSIVDQVVNLVQNLPDYIGDLQDNKTIRDLDEDFQVLDRLQEAVQSNSLFENVLGGVVGAAQLLASAAFKFLTVLILTLYFLASFPSLKALAYRTAPASRRPRVEALGDEILSRAGGYVIGQLAIVTCAGITTYVFLRILGAPYAAALALVIAVFDLVPMVGATIGAVVVSILVATQSLTEGIACLIFFIIYQQVENYLIYPRVMKHAVNVHPAAALVAALVGGGLLGFAGAILAVPTVAAIQLILEEVVLPRQDTS